MALNFVLWCFGDWEVLPLWEPALPEIMDLWFWWQGQVSSITMLNRPHRMSTFSWLPQNTYQSDLLLETGLAKGSTTRLWDPFLSDPACLSQDPMGFQDSFGALCPVVSERLDIHRSNRSACAWGSYESHEGGVHNHSLSRLHSNFRLPRMCTESMTLFIMVTHRIEHSRPKLDVPVRESAGSDDHQGGHQPNGAPTFHSLKLPSDEFHDEFNQMEEPVEEPVPSVTVRKS